MDQRLFDRFPDLPDRKMWPAFLVDAVDSGEYRILEHEGDQVVLLSMIPDDLIQVRRNGTVQARLAINLKTGVVVHPLLGVNINRWQAEVCGKVDLYEQRLQQLRDRPLDLSEWDYVGRQRGIPKENR